MSQQQQHQQQQQQQQQKTRIDYMSRRVPTNPRYADVKAVTDTGASLSKHVEKINEIKANFKYRKDELFKRMKISTLVQLMVQVTEFNYDFPPEEEIPSGGRQQEMEEVRSTMQSVISGRGETAMRQRAAGLPSGYEEPRPSGPKLALEVPYLLLDVREADAYEKCHVITSLNYPSSRLARVMNFETPELLAYKNKEGRIIVLYDEEENLAPRVAQTFVERGYDNLFLLSGGMKVALQVFPVGLFTGAPPRHLKQSNSNGNNRAGGGGGAGRGGKGVGVGAANGRSAHSASMRNSSSNPSLISSSSSSNGNHHDNNDNNNSYQDNDVDADIDIGRLGLGDNDNNDDDDDNHDDNQLSLRDLNALKMALEVVMTPPEMRAPPKTGRLATAASVGKEQRATANAKMTARKDKLVGGKEWK